MKHFLQQLIALIFFSSLLINTGCKKDNPPPAILPTITQEGKNTVGFTINGDVWVPYASCSGWGANPCGEISAYYGRPWAQQDQISFSFKRKIGDKLSSFRINSPGFGETITTIGNKIDSIRVSYTPEIPSSGGAPDFGYPRPGSYFNVTFLDHQNQIISGNFKFILRGYGTGEELILDNGRFDFKFYACKCSR